MSQTSVSSHRDDHLQNGTEASNLRLILAVGDECHSEVFIHSLDYYIYYTRTLHEELYLVQYYNFTVKLFEMPAH